MSDTIVLSQTLSAKHSNKQGNQSNITSQFCHGFLRSGSDLISDLQVLKVSVDQKGVEMPGSAQLSMIPRQFDPVCFMLREDPGVQRG